jgi:hypothetical protein
MISVKPNIVKISFVYIVIVTLCQFERVDKEFKRIN